MNTPNSSIVDLSAGPAKWLANPEVEQRLGQALGGWMSKDEFVAQLLIAFQDPAIKTTTAKSQYEAAHTCAALSLLPTLGQVALIARNNKVSLTGEKDRFENQCTVMPQWQGYKAIMERNPEVQDVTAHLVHASDNYKVVNGRIDHNPDPFREDRDFNNILDVRGGYLIIQYKDPARPDKHFFVTSKYIAKAKACAMTQKIWSAWFEQMCLKTVYRAGFSRRVVPVDPAVAKRVQAITEQEDVIHQNDPRAVTLDVVSRKPPESVASQAINAIEQFGKQVIQEEQTIKPVEKQTETPASKPDPEQGQSQNVKDAQEFINSAKSNEKKPKQLTEGQIRQKFSMCRNVVDANDMADAMVNNNVADINAISAVCQERIEELA